ncbi:MAG: tetratricopeptide repeat protein [Candidatus Latescibacteria bacterium]|nr:tetratricopeptide repeat protein [Candidatus Latescibacterota bacterium]
MLSKLRGARGTALVALLAAGLYLNTWSHGFHYDDFHSLVHNPHLRSLGKLPAFFTDPTLFSTNPESAMYRPVLLVSYALNYALGGMEPGGYHLANALIHGVNAGLVHRLLLALGQGGLALPAALVFALTPANSEAVNYVSSRSELLMATFFLLACLAHLRGGPVGKAAGMGAAALALLTKSVAAVLSPVLALCDWLREGRGARRHWPALVALAGLALGYVVFTRQLVGQALLEPIRPHGVHLYTQAKAGVYYLLLLVMPVHLSVEHQFSLAHSPFEGPVLAAILLLLSLGLVVWPWRRGRFAAGWVLLLLLPTTLVPLVVLVNEHRLYLAGIAFALMLAWAWQEMGRRRPVAWAAFGVYNIMLCVLTLERGAAWADELSLWRDAALKAPQMLKPHLRLADALAGTGRLAEAEQEYLRAVALRPQHPGARNNLGLLYLRQGRLPQAREQFAALLKTSPDQIPARLNLASILLAQGQWQEAVGQYQLALDQGENEGEAEAKLGWIALHYQQAPQQALDLVDRALGKRQNAQWLVWRGVALRALRRGIEAEAAYQQALQLDPACAEAWYNLGNLWTDRGEQGRAAEAYQRVETLAPPESELGRLARQHTGNRP